MFKGINHVGIVVKDVEEYAAFLKKTIGAEVVETVRFEEAGQVSCLVQFGDSKYELMSPIGEEGVVGKFHACGHLFPVVLPTLEQQKKQEGQGKIGDHLIDNSSDGIVDLRPLRQSLKTYAHGNILLVEFC